MTHFSYSARDRNGKIITGHMDAPDRQAVVAALRAGGNMPLSIESGRIALRHMLQTELTTQRLSLEDRAGFFWQLSTYLDAGLSLADALRQIAGGYRKEAISGALEAAAQAVAEGAGLEVALAQEALALEDADLALIGVGARSGTLPHVMTELATQYEGKAARRAALISALIYPSILFLTAVGVVILMMAVVVPEFEPIFTANGQELPWLTQLVRDASHGLVAALPYAALLLLGAGFLLASAQRRPAQRARLHRLMLSAPYVGRFLKRASLARLARALSLMLTGGVPLHDALTLAAGAEPNLAVAATLQDAAAAVRGGSAVHAALVQTGLSDGNPLPLVELGEKSGRMAHTLARLGDIAEREQASDLARLAAIATPSLTLVMGGMIGTIVWAVMSAILDINRLV